MFPYQREVISGASDPSAETRELPPGYSAVPIKMGTKELIVNELLCYITNKLDIMDQDSMILMCFKTFSDDDVIEAKSKLKDTCTTLDILGSLRIGARSGSDKKKKNLEDIISMAHKLGDVGPTFVASDLRKLPPVNFDSVDVTHLLYRLERLETEAESRKEVDKKTTAIIENLEKEVASLKNTEARSTTLLESVLVASSSDSGAKSRQSDLSNRGDSSDSFFTPMKDAKNNPLSPKGNTLGEKRNDKFPPGMTSLSLMKKIRDARNKTDLNSIPSIEPPQERQSSNQISSPEILDQQLPPRPRYSDALRDGEPQPWKLVQKKGRNSKLVQGKLQGASSVKVAIRSTNLFTKGWGTNETSQGVENFLKSSYGLNAKCDEIRTRALSYKCFKVTIQITNDIDFYDPGIWPIGVRIGKFYNPSKRNSDQTKSEKARPRSNSTGY